MNCIILRRTFSVLPFLRLLGRQKEETEGKEGEGGKVLRAGLSGSTEEDQQFGSPPSLPLCQKHSRGAFRLKWRKPVCSSPVVTANRAGPPDVLSAFSSSCLVRRLPSFRKVHSILKGRGYKTQFNPLQKRDGEGEGEGKGKKKISDATE